MSARPIMVTIGGLGLVWGLASEAIYYDAGTPAHEVLLDLAIGWTYLFGGLAIWASRPANRTGRLMTLVGLTWFVGNLAISELSGLREIGTLFSGAAGTALVALVLAYPSGRLETRLDRITVAILAIGWFATGAVQVLPLTSGADLGVGLLVVNGALAAVAGIVVVRRWVVAPRHRRAELVPVLLAGTIQMAVLATFVIVQVVPVPENLATLLLAAKNLAPAAIPLALLVGFYREGEVRRGELVDELRLSRSRIVEATDAERRRLERDLHDGAQQRLVSLALALRLVRSKLDEGLDTATAAGLDDAAIELRTALGELRELAHGIHPAILTEAGLGPALDTLAARSSVAAAVLALPDRRLSPAVEATAYFVVSEALANVAKYASASNATVSAVCPGDSLRVEVADDGVGGADPTAGTGLRGLADRVAAVGGSLAIISPPGGGTRVVAEIPLA